MVAVQEELKHHDVVTDVHAVNDEKKDLEDDADVRQIIGHPDQDPETIPTPEEMRTLRKVPAAMPLVGLAMCLIEFSERASYYGSQGPFNNFLVSALMVSLVVASVAVGRRRHTSWRNVSRALQRNYGRRNHHAWL